jgi:ABC-type oligopeptide transport system substrate-binding subunit/predicted Ser/Thr protein kinase
MKVGDLLQDRYRLEAEIGQGGMGIVYRAHDQLLDRSIAIKLMNKADFDSQGRSRLLDEARTAAKLNHPNIVSVHDAGEIDGTPFIVMEFVEGTSLHDRKVESLEDSLDIIRQLCDALEHAHAHDIIHRDLKPENVLITTDGVAKLSDFGLARSISSRLTSEGMIVGTVFYLAPEMAQGRGFDGRADLYALGVMLYELTTGELPFQADNPISVISLHLNSPVVPPRAKNESIPHRLNSLILRLLNKSPDDRPASAGDLLRELQKPDLLDEDGVAPEEISILDRIQRGRMIGRETEYKQATALWSEVLSGQGRVLMISGEPGIGKSRLVRELAAHAEVTGGWVVEGASYAESGSPYGPFRQVLREAFSKDSESCCDLPQEVLADVLSLAPELKTQFPEVLANPLLDPQAERQRLFENMVIFFSSLSDHAPLLLILEDAHWADSGTLALMLHLARNTRHKRLMIAAPYREVELDEARPFHEVLLDIQRERLAERLKINRLTRSQSKDLLEVLFAEESTPDFLGGIYRETEGNPFFIEEVCKAMLASGKLTYEDGRWHRPSMEELGVPQSVQVAIQSRVRRLPEVSQEILRLAAVVGRVFDIDTIAKTSDLEEDQLIDAMEDAEDAQLIERVNGREGGEYRFSHALIPAALVVGLRTRKRRRLHRDVAVALEKICPDDFEKLAYHYNHANEDEKAAFYYLEAGDRARNLYAFQEAIESYEQALEILMDNEKFDLAARTLTKLGLSHHNAFDFEASREAYEAGFSLWQRSIDVERPSTPQPAPHAFRFAFGEPETLDPSLLNTSVAALLLGHLFRGLLQLSPTLNLIPDMARSWEVKDGGRTYFFNLREDATWTDGVKVTAGDYEYALKRVLNPEFGAPLAHLLLDIKGAEDYLQGRNDDPEQIGVKAADDHTLIIELEAPTSYFLYLMAHPISFAVPQHVVEKDSSAWAERESIVTNGPFQMASRIIDESLVLSRNPAYQGNFPGNVERIEWTTTQIDPSEELKMYLSGDFDLFGNLLILPRTERERVRHLFSDEYRTYPGFGTGCLNINSEQPPFDNRNVRRAFALALDRDLYVHEVFGEDAVSPAMGGFIPPGIAGHSPGIGLRFDPQRARALLEEAGFPSGEGFPPVVLYTQSNPLGRALFENIKRQWLQNLGVEIINRSFEFTEYFRHVALDAPLICMAGWVADYPDPDNFLRTYPAHFSVKWGQETFDELVEKARRMPDQSERIRLYQEADRILIEDAAIVPLAYGRNDLLVKPWVKNMTFPPLSMPGMKYIVIEPHE